MRLYYLLLLLAFQPAAIAQVELRYEDNYSLAYEEVIRAYRDLAEAYEEASLLECGPTDAGKPLHLFVVSSSGIPWPGFHKNERILFILNGIHPGESCGIDASVEFARELLEQSSEIHPYLENTVVCIVPVFNIGGALNRSLYHRSNMDPPVEAGFRGNARNLDLNRDFVKLDSRNARSLVQVFHQWDPDVFLDNHVTNGSDHQYTITLVTNVLQKLDPGLARFLDSTMLPELYAGMRKTPYEMCPYVSWAGPSPDKGIIQQEDPPRYAAGLSALFNTISLLNEIHVYKPFPDQVRATEHFMKVLLETTSRHAEDIGSLREKAKEATSSLEDYVIRWELDTSRWDDLYFKGYTYKKGRSELTGLDRYYYDREDPWEKIVPYYRYYRPVLTVPTPRFYVIPQAWAEVIDRLALNRIRMHRLERDTLMQVEAFYIDRITYADRPQQGHFMHPSIEVRSEKQEIRFYAGDRVIPVNQPGNRYLMETLDPRAVDSYLRWNFFDPVLDRREYTDPVSFEKKAAAILEQDPGLRSELEKQKEEDPDFAASHRAQMYFIYTRSPWAEKSYLRYPVYRSTE